jgi:hypothetical protein
VLEVELARDEAVELAYGLVAREAERIEVRVLALKGPVLQKQGIGARRTSADADILVSGAAEVDQLVQRLVALGWEKRPTSEVLRVYPEHSVELFHPRWPCDIDLHRFYPGLFAPAGETFELLWAEHTTVTLAGRRVDAPSPAAQLMVLAAHALRSRAARGQADLSLVIGKLNSDDDLRRDFERLATRTRSRYVLDEVLSAIGAESSTDLSPREEEAWDRLVAGNGKSTAYHAYSSFVTGPFRSRLRAGAALVRAGVASARATSRQLPDGSLRPPWWRRLSPLMKDVRMARREYSSRHPRSPKPKRKWN